MTVTGQERVWSLRLLGFSLRVAMRGTVPRLAETFLANADADAHAANDELLSELRGRYRSTNGL